MNDNFKDYSSGNYPRSSGQRPTSGERRELQSQNYYKRGTGSGYNDMNRVPNRKRRKRRKKNNSTLFLIIVAILILVGIIVLIKNCNSCGTNPGVVSIDPTTATFKDGVSISGINVTGLTIDNARSALAQTVQQKINSINITLQGDGFSEVITGDQLHASSDLEDVMVAALSGGSNQSYDTTITLDHDALSDRISQINSTFTQGATDATFSIGEDSKGRPSITFTEGTPGVGLDVDETEKLVKEALQKGNYNATLTPVLSYVNSAITVDVLKKRMSERGSFVTTFCAKRSTDDPIDLQEIEKNRAFNVEKCASIIDGYCVQPGEKFSFNKVVGDRNEKNGWKEAKGIYGGESYNMQYGGGVCQVSTTLYCALIQSGLPYSEMSRRHHSIPSTYVDKGMDATVDTGHIDFTFKNTTNYPIYMFTYITTTKDRSRYRDLHVVIYGEELPAGTSYKMRSVIVSETEPGNTIIEYDKHKTTDYMEETVAAHNGYEADVYLDTLMNDNVVSSEKLYTDEYLPITQKIKMGTLSPSPVPEKTAAPETHEAEEGTEEMP